jgi:hypothetical protein
MNLWPVSLQSKLNTQDFGYTFGKTTIETEMDVGLKKKRRLYTKAVDEIKCSIDVDMTQYNTFYTFFDITLNGGANTFWFNNPITQVSEEYRFSDAAPPVVSPLGGLYFRITMSWIRIPV